MTAREGDTKEGRTPIRVRIRRSVAELATERARMRHGMVSRAPFAVGGPCGRTHHVGRGYGQLKAESRRERGPGRSGRDAT